MQSALYMYIYAVSVTTYFRFSTFAWKPVAEVCYILCFVSVVPSISDQSTKRGCLLGAPRPGNYVHIALPSTLLYLLKCFVNFLLCFLTHSTTYKKYYRFCTFDLKLNRRYIESTFYSTKTHEHSPLCWKYNVVSTPQTNMFPMCTSAHKVSIAVCFLKFTQLNRVAVCNQGFLGSLEDGTGPPFQLPLIFFIVIL